MDDIKFMTGLHVEPVVASETRDPRGHLAVLRAEDRRAGRASRAPDLANRALEELGRQDDDLEVVTDAEETRRGRARAAGRRSAHHQARQRPDALGDSEGRERHPHRAVREGDADPIPHRRPAPRGDDAGASLPRPDRLARQDHGAARHRREAAAAGRPHQGAVRRSRPQPRHRLPRVGPADALRRKGRPASARSRGPQARHVEARVRVRTRSQSSTGRFANRGAWCS